MIDINFTPEYLAARTEAFTKTLNASRKWELIKSGNKTGEVMFYPEEVEAFAIGYDAGVRAGENLRENLNAK